WLSPALFVELQIPRLDQVQGGVGLGHQAAALVVDGLFQGVAGQAAVAGGAAVGGLPALVIPQQGEGAAVVQAVTPGGRQGCGDVQQLVGGVVGELRSEEHTSELQSRFDLVCRLLPEKKKNR